MGGIVLALPLPNFFSAVGVVLLGLGLAPIFPGMLHETPRRFGETASQAVMGLQMSFTYIGATCFPPLFGTLAAWSGIRILPGFALVCIGIMFAASELLRRKLNTSTPSLAPELEGNGIAKNE